MTVPSDRNVLRKLASQVTEGVILEIGSKNGHSTRALVECSKVPVYCIDMWDVTFLGDNRPDVHMHDDSKFKDRMQGLEYTAIKGISGEIYKAWNRLIGLLFIDGDHSYEGLMTDYQFAKFIIKGGFLVIHDHIGKYKGVMKGVAEISQLEEWTDWTQEGFSTIWARRA